MTNNYTYSQTISPKQAEILLSKVWGLESPLADLGKAVNYFHLRDKRKFEINEELMDSKIIVGLEAENKLIGLSALKLHPWKEAELSSVAILPEYRGKNLSKLLYSPLRNFCEILIGEGYIVSTYATLGSAIMYKITGTMENLTNIKPWPMNIAPFINKTELLRCKKNVEKPIYFLQKDKSAYTSTIQLICSANKTLFGSSKALRSIKIKHAFLSNIFDWSFYNKEFSCKKNSFVKLPNRLILIDINNNEGRIEDTMMKKLLRDFKTPQIRIPISNNFIEIIKKFYLDDRYVFTGFTLTGEWLRVCFMMDNEGGFKEFLSELQNEDFFWVKDFVQLIYDANYS